MREELEDAGCDARPEVHDGDVCCVVHAVTLCAETGVRLTVHGPQLQAKQQRIVNFL